MAIIANLQVAIGADTKGLKTGMDKAKQEMSVFTAQANKVGTALTRAFGITAIVAGAAIAVKNFGAELVRLSVGIESVNNLKSAFDGLKSTLAEFIAPATKPVFEAFAESFRRSTVIMSSNLSIWEKLKPTLKPQEAYLAALMAGGTTGETLDIAYPKGGAKKLPVTKTPTGGSFTKSGLLNWDDALMGRTGLEGLPTRDIAASLRAMTGKDSDLAQAAAEAGMALGEQFSDAMRDAITGGITDMASIIGEGIATGFEGFGDNVLRVIGKFAQQIGSILIAIGMAGFVMKSGAWLASPAIAIAAGATLVALGSALSAAAAAGPTGGGGGGGYGGGAYASSGYPMAVEMTGVLRGTDIYISNKRTARRMRNST